MKMLTRVILLSLSFLLTNAFSRDNLSQSVIDFIKHREKPTKTNLLLGCWTNYEIKTFSKALSGYDILSRVISIEEYKATDKSAQLEMIIMDFDCYNFNNTWKNEALLQFPRRWFIFIDSITTFTENLPLWINTRVYLFQKQPPHVLTSPYLVLNTSFYQYNQLSSWSNGSYTAPVADILDYQHRVNQNGLIMNSTGVVLYPRTIHHLMDLRYLNEDAITKHNYVLLHHIEDILNVKLNISWTPSWGTRAPNSSRYTYMMGDLQSGVADIGATIGYFTKDRFAFADYIANPVPTVGKFILKSPSLSTVNNILTMPFELNVWICLAALTVFMVALMLITVKWEWMVFKFDEDTNKLRPNTMEIVQFQMGVVCQQGIEKEPSSLPGKIITFSALLSFLFFYTAYSACIVALLQSTSSSISRLEDLLQTNIKLGVDNSPYSKFFFSRQRGEVKEAIYREKLAPPNKPDNFVPVPVGVQKMRTEFFAFHSERDAIYKQISKTFLEHEKCGIVEITYLSETEPYLAVRKRLPYKEIIKIAYSRFKENGLSNRMYKLLYVEKPKCIGSGGSFRSVGINDAYFAVLIYAVGVAVAILINVIERIVKKR